MKIRVTSWPRKANISTFRETLKAKGKFIIPCDAGHHPDVINIPQLREKKFQEFSEEMAKMGFVIEKA